MANVYPNTDTYNFCQWVLTSEYYRMTAPRRALVTTVSNAANTGGFVSQHQWNQFINITQLLYLPWQQNVALTNVPMWVDYSGTSIIVGFSSFIVKEYFYSIVGKQMFVNVLLEGTSNSTSLTFTLPRSIASAQAYCINVARSLQGSTGSVGLFYGTGGSSLVTCYFDATLGAWSASGTKAIAFSMVLPID